MDQPTQNIDISPQAVSPIAQAGLKLLNLETTLVPGNLRGQLGMLEVYLSGLATGQLVLAPTPVAPVESEVKEPDVSTGPQDDGPGPESTNRSASLGEEPSKT